MGYFPGKSQGEALSSCENCSLCPVLLAVRLGGGGTDVMAEGRKLDELGQSSQLPMFYAEKPRIFLNALRKRCKRSKRAKGLLGEEATWPPVNGQNQWTPSKGGCMSIRSSPIQTLVPHWLSITVQGKAEINSLLSRVSENTENSRIVFSSTHTATRSHKQAIFLIYPDAVLENSKGRRIQP